MRYNSKGSSFKRNFFNFKQILYLLEIKKVSLNSFTNRSRWIEKKTVEFNSKVKFPPTLDEHICIKALICLC